MADFKVPYRFKKIRRVQKNKNKQIHKAYIEEDEASDEEHIITRRRCMTTHGNHNKEKKNKE